MTFTTPRRLVRVGVTLLLAFMAVLALQPGSATASPSTRRVVTPPPKTFTWSGEYRTPDGKTETGSATFTSRPGQTVNPVKLVTHLHVSNPYWFVGARGSITATIYHDTAYGPVAMWEVTHSLTACGKTDPTCSSAPTGDWTNLPPIRQIKRLEKGASYMLVELNLN